MKAGRWSTLTVMVLTVFGISNVSYAQNYPARPVRIVTSAPGGSSDFAARLVAQGLASGLGQQVIIENRGGGVAAIEIVAKAQPDGYTLLYYGSILWLLPLMQEAKSYDTLRDFAPVALAVTSPNIVLVHPSVQAKTVKELIALAKSKPGALNYGSGGAGSSGHLAAELFKSMAGVDMVRIPFKGSGPALTAIIANEIQVLMSSAGGMNPHIKSGRVRALAVTSAKRSASFPDLPTVAEAGVPGYEYGQMSGLFAPVKTAAAIVNRLSQETVRAANLPEIKDKLFSAGVDAAPNSSPREFTAQIKSEISRLGKVIKDAGIRSE
jgi:tripartite-type tricarboxylate transporter receptor subunit TctC